MPKYLNKTSKHMNHTNGPIVPLALLTVLLVFYLPPSLWVLTDFLFGWGQSHPWNGDWLITVCLASPALCSLGCRHQQTGLPKSVRKSLHRLQHSETVKGHRNMAIKAVNVWGLCVFFSYCAGVRTYVKHIIRSGRTHFSNLRIRNPERKCEKKAYQKNVFMFG